MHHSARGSTTIDGLTASPSGAAGISRQRNAQPPTSILQPSRLLSRTQITLVVVHPCGEYETFERFVEDRGWKKLRRGQGRSRPTTKRQGSTGEAGWICEPAEVESAEWLRPVWLGRVGFEEIQVHLRESGYRVTYLTIDAAHPRRRAPRPVGALLGPLDRLG